MSDFLSTKDVFEKKVEKGMEYGFTFNDFDSIRKMKNRVSRMDQSNPEVRALYSKICSLSDRLFKEGGAHKFSKKNREYILSHCLLLPLVLRDCNRLNVDIMGDQVITDVSFEVSKPITMRELDNVYLEKRVDHSRIEELYPDKPELILTPASYLGKVFKIGYNDSLELLCRIYKLPLPKKSKFHNKNLFLYRRPYVKAITDDEAFDRIMTVLDYEKEIMIEDNGLKEVNGVDIEKLFEERKQIIERVKRDEFDPDFTYEEPDRVFLHKNK